MALVKWKCVNLGNCPKANSGTVFEIASGEHEPKCDEPECGRPLIRVQKTRRFPALPLIIAVAVVILLGWLLWPTHHQIVTIDLAITAPNGFKQNLEIVSSNAVVTFAVKSSSGNETDFPIENKKIQRLPIHYSSQEIPKSLYTRVNSGPWVIHTFEVPIIAKLPVTNNVAIVQPPAPPAFMLQSALPLVLESNMDSLELSFTLFGGSTNPDNLNFSATTVPSGTVATTIRANGANRTVTLSRNQRENGLVKLAVRLVTPDGRETNQTYDVTVIPPPPPTLAINVTATTPPAASVHPGEEMAWIFSVDGGGASEKPVVVANSLSPVLLPASALKLVPIDQTSRNFKLTVRPTGEVTGHIEIRISVSLDGAVKDTTLAFEIIPIPPVIAKPQTPGPTFDQLMAKAREARRLKQYPDALEYVNQAEQLEPRNLVAWNFKAIIYYSWGHYNDSLNTANQVLQTDPQNADGWFIKGASEEYSGKKREALESYRQFIKFCTPGDPRRADVQNRIVSLQTELNGK